MRHWLLTNTTYGTWLPGDARWSFTDITGKSELTPPLPRLERYAATLQQGSTVLLTRQQADVLACQFRETAAHRGWTIHAGAVMVNHSHLIVQVDGDPDPRRLLADFKAYGTRSLNREFGKPSSGTWWTTRGSKRKLPDERALKAAVNYVLHKQPNPLVTWAGDDALQ